MFKLRPWSLCCLALLGALVAHPRRAHAGAWGKPQWGFYLQLGTSFTWADRRYVNNTLDTVPMTVGKDANPADPRRAPIGINTSNYQQLLTDLYWELGLGARITLFGNFGVVSQRQANGEGTAEEGDISYHTNGVTDFLLGARVAILENPFALALETRIVFPTGDAKAIVPTGSGDFRTEVRLAAGKAWSNIVVPVYIDGEVGFMLRGSGDIRSYVAADNFIETKHYAPEIVVHAELGLTVFRQKQVDRLLLIGSVDYRGSTANDDLTTTNPTELFSLLPRTQMISSGSATLMGFIWRGLGVSLRYQGVFAGLHMPKTMTVAGAIFASF